MTYIMSRKMYAAYTLQGKDSLAHNELIEYINKSFGLCGKVTDVILK